ncbi:MAG: phage baseplate assembly protein V [Selenomonadaceae bacterium]|nr:phage baseplate assembly protein V [Selenomonadaceae bacterium]
MRISGFENIFYLTKFNIKKSCGEHSICTFSCSVSECDETRLLKQTGQEIQIVWEDGEKEKCIFCGKIEEIQVSKLLHSTTVDVRAVSLSVAEDEKPYTRIWQNPDKKMGDILSASKLTLEVSDLKLSPALNSQKYPLPVLQNQETNFVFLKRIAGYMGIPLWVEDIKSGKGGIVLSETISDMTHEIKPEDILRYTVSKSRNGKRIIAITTKKYLPFGSKAKISREANEYVICDLQINLVHEIYEFTYLLEPYVSWKYEASKLPHLEKTLYLKGKVENNKDQKNMGRIQVSFDGVNVQDMDRERLWISYQSPYTGLSGGIVFLPDVGDMVNVIFSNEGIYATAALRENTLAEECRNVSEKYIGNNTKQRIFLREKELKIASGDNTILLDNEKIELVVGESKITLTKDKITLQQGKTEFLLTNKGSYIKSNDNEMAWNEQGIIGKSSKEIGLISKGKINITGNGEINIEAKGNHLSLNGSVVNIG